ncbi:restriction endonuclease subunit S [Xanthomarina sp.]|uniref:restriction endonuclease subunit S n=1 Tax=Xanthomarina sp. TaxID=1931211 RepID=UPI002C02C784|nr:restriction endonuclease subunit S [Xanthomarina sp.]HLV37868.1 restriction endonuclease subunit S [Xanthomarina sp.]
MINKYDSYKDSGVKWLGEIPEHWELKRFKHIFKEKKITYNVELNSGSISFGKVVYKDDEKIPESTKRSYQVLNKGEFLINPLNLNYDLISLRIALSDKDVVVSSGYIIVQNVIKLSKEYYKWLLHIFDVAYMKTLGAGVRQTLSFTHIANSEFVFPPLPEQTAIAKFLDDKTEKIDQAIGIKEQQIALLKERKQILVHKAVTRGLNDKVALKDSGVEWIGEIPEHWEVTKAKYYSTIFVPERAKPDLNTDGKGFPWVTTEHLRSVELFETAVNYCVNESSKKKTGSRIIEAGSVLATCVGNFGIASTLNFDCIINQQIQGFTNLKIDANYLTYLVRLSEDYFKNNSTLTTIMYVNKDTFGNMPITLPPISEQKEISSYIESASQKIDTAISLKTQEIEKLQEYKSSLINSVVTGKVRVS